MFFKAFVESQYAKPENTKPVINPPVASNKLPKPPRKPAKTGKPTAPIKIYSKTERVPFLPPKR